MLPIIHTRLGRLGFFWTHSFQVAEKYPEEMVQLLYFSKNHSSTHQSCIFMRHRIMSSRRIEMHCRTWLPENNHQCQLNKRRCSGGHQENIYGIMVKAQIWKRACSKKVRNIRIGNVFSTTMSLVEQELETRPLTTIRRPWGSNSAHIKSTTDGKKKSDCLICAIIWSVPRLEKNLNWLTHIATFFGNDGLANTSIKEQEIKVFKRTCGNPEMRRTCLACGWFREMLRVPTCANHWSLHLQRWCSAINKCLDGTWRASVFYDGVFEIKTGPELLVALLKSSKNQQKSRFGILI